jgi:hypothetical protein
MPGGDGTGPVWIIGRDWRCKGFQINRRHTKFRFWQKYQLGEQKLLSKNEKKKLLEKELENIDKEKQEIEKRLKEIEFGD